jgi:hypothetical protein
MDVKRKAYDIRTWKKHLLLDISSTNIDTAVPSLYRCVETRSTEVFWLVSQPLPHLRFNFFFNSKTPVDKMAISRPSCEQLYATNAGHSRRAV